MVKRNNKCMSTLRNVRNDDLIQIFFLSIKPVGVKRFKPVKKPETVNLVKCFPLVQLLVFFTLFN